MSFTFLLIHSPILGPSTWRGVADALEKRGHKTITPSLAPAFAGAPPYYAKAAEVVAAAMRSVSANEIVVAAHAGGGPLLPLAIAAAAPARARAGIFVDAIMPHPGRSIFDETPVEIRDSFTAAAKNGKLPAWNKVFGDAAFAKELPDQRQRDALSKELIEMPLAFFDEHAPPNDPVKGVPIGYVQLTEPYQTQYDDALWMRWNARQELGGGYFALLTQAERVADAMVAIAEKPKP